MFKAVNLTKLGNVKTISVPRVKDPVIIIVDITIIIIINYYFYLSFLFQTISYLPPTSLFTGIDN